MRQLLLYLMLCTSLLAKQDSDESISLGTIPNIRQHYYDSMSISKIRSDLSIPRYSYSKLYTFDKEYIGVTYDYFLQYNKWWDNIKTKYLNVKSSAFDCDNYAFMYKSLLTSAVVKYPKMKQILVGVIIVDQKKTTLGIKAGATAKHALCVVYTSEGWIVVEPQTLQHTPLKEYKNYIYKYIF